MLATVQIYHHPWMMSHSILSPFVWKMFAMEISSGALFSTPGKDATRRLTESSRQPSLYRAGPLNINQNTASVYLLTISMFVRGWKTNPTSEQRLTPKHGSRAPSTSNHEEVAATTTWHIQTPAPANRRAASKSQTCVTWFARERRLSTEPGQPNLNTNPNTEKTEPPRPCLRGTSR